MLKTPNQLQSEKKNVSDIPEGFLQLHSVLMAAMEQASAGKGQERHANGLPFHDQRMQRISTLLDSPDGMAFQVIKKMTEGLQFNCPERREAELLGAINYLAGIVVWYRNMPVRNAAKDGWTPEAIDAAAFPADYDESRIDVIGQNGNDGAAYEQRELLVLPEDLVVPVEVEWIGVDADGEVRGFEVKPAEIYSNHYSIAPGSGKSVSLFWQGKGDGSLKLYKRASDGFERVELMASKAQKNRVTRAVRALIRSNNVCIINTQHQQGLFDWRSIRPIIGKHVAAAMVEVPFRGWTLFPIGICVDDFGKRYFKYDQVVIEEMYTSAQLGGLDERYGVMQADGIKLSLIDHHAKALRDRCQPAHIQSTAWLLIPEVVDIDQRHLDLILDALGAWGEKV